MDGHGQRVMAVDNDRTVLELLQIRLEVAGYRAFIMRSGRQALDLAPQIRPAAMIVAAQLGESDGFEIVSAIRARCPDQIFPILMTGRGLTADDVRRALVCGAQNCMAKPFSGAEAVERIGRLLQAAHRPPPPAAGAEPAPVFYI
ncbi:MAG TPA: response regulator [Caulobacteraceae bacterium]|jgi:two-component system catabolic regulation response regulator CreB